MTYGETLRAKCSEIERSNPEVKKIVDAVLKVDRMSNFEFDYDIERTHMMYTKVLKLLPTQNKNDTEQ